MELLKGAAVSAKIKEEIEKKMELWKGLPPKLAIVRVGENPDDVSYERSAVKRMESFGLRAETFTFPGDISDEMFQCAFRSINEDRDVDGILLLRPLPKQICEKEIERMILPEKDLDGISPENIAKVFAADKSGFAPCTAEAVVEILKGYDVDVSGKRVTIVGRSMVVGKPLAMLMLRENATVTICHTKTENLPETCRNADILVAAAGKAHMVNDGWVGKDAVVVDVGINVDENGKLCGDVDMETLESAKAVTPVPGGVGAVTTAVLARHLLLAGEMRKQ